MTSNGRSAKDTPTRLTNRSSGAPLHWPAVEGVHAWQAWADLRDWVDDYAARFGLDSRTIPTCWYRHNAMVEALAALRDHERASYEYSDSKTTGVEFIRASREIGIFLRELTGRTGCTGGVHRPGPPRPAVDDRDWLDFVENDERVRRAQPLDETDENQ